MTASSSAATQQLAKRAIRESVLRQRDALTPSQRQRDAAMCIEALLKLDRVAHANTLLSYIGFGTEIDTMPIFTAARARAAVVALPRMTVDTTTKTSALVLHRVDERAELVAGLWGIQEPAATAPVVALSELDVAIVPGVAFDRAGHRLGYGKGYYDRLLAGRPKSLFVVALAFDCQLVDDVPVSAHDVAIDMLITPSQQLTFQT